MKPRVTGSHRKRIDGVVGAVDGAGGAHAATGAGERADVSGVRVRSWRAGRRMVVARRSTPTLDNAEARIEALKRRVIELEQRLAPHGPRDAADDALMRVIASVAGDLPFTAAAVWRRRAVNRRSPPHSSSAISSPRSRSAECCEGAKGVTWTACALCASA